MKVRELIHHLQQHDQDMDVVLPSETVDHADFVVVSLVEADVFVRDPADPDNFQLADLRDRGSFTAVRLCGGRR